MDFDPRKEQKLPNGAYVVDYEYILSDTTIVYLCHWPDHYIPFVTWLASPREPGCPFAGNYFQKLQSALDDFNARIGR